MVGNAQFQNQVSVTVDEIPEDQLDDVLSSFDIASVESTFKTIESSVNQETSIVVDSIFTSPNTVNALVTNPDPVNVVVMRVGSTIQVIDSGVLFKNAAEPITKYQPLYAIDNNNVGVASNQDITHFNRFIGIALDNALIGEQVPIKISNTITEPTWDWNLDEEILLGDRVLEQQHSVDPHFNLIIANVLTPNTIQIVYTQPDDYTDII